MARRKKKITIENLEVIDFTVEGKAVAKTEEGQVVFVKDAVPGDVVDVLVSRKRKSFMEGSAIKFHRYSDLRIEPFCEHFGVCGGCKWQHIPYDKQLAFKAKQVQEALERIGQVEVESFLPIIPSDKIKYYRNKLSYTFSSLRWLLSDEVKQESVAYSDRRALGFHVPGRFDRILDVETCYLQPDFTNKLRNKVRDFTIQQDLTFYNHRTFEGFLRDLIVRNNTKNEWMVIVVFQHDIQEQIVPVMEFIKTNFPEVISLHYIINPKKNDSVTDLPTVLYHGEPQIIESLDDIQYMVSPQSFFQTNTEQALKLYTVTREFAGLTGNENVYDLYTGTGSIALFLAAKAKKVVGVEYVEEAIEDAHKNAALNNITNALFYASDLKDVFNEDFIAKHGKPDVLITDPPRTGMHPDVVKTILKAAPGRIVYVSCNPATQARDISMLSELYKVKKVQPVDMFPHTSHIENVALLELK